ncbi:MAG: type II secretion system F family protein [Paenibacillaceae bacterium]
MDKRRAYYLKENDQKRLNHKSFNLLVQLQVYKQMVRQRMVSKKKNDKLEIVLNRAGVLLKPEEFVMFQWIAMTLGGGVMYLLTGRIFFLALGCVMGFVAPRMIVRRKQQKRLSRFNDGLPDLITTVIGSLRAGFSFIQSLKTVTDEADSPIKEEIELVLKEMQYGSTIEDALQQLKDRIPSEDLELMIQAILIQKQVGGNLATVLETIVQTIRDRNKIHRQIHTLTAQGRLSGTIIGLLPVVLGLFLYLIDSNYMGKFLAHPIGMVMIGVGAVSGTIGFILIRKITTIEV